jgi:tRNA threonylcarbamoyladenosine biosynthesis protein TsaE
VQDIGFEEYLEARGVVIVEWADKFPQLLPAERLEVYIRIAASGRRCMQWMAYDMFYGRYFLHAD